MPDMVTKVRRVRKQRKGIVVSKSGCKTIVVRVEIRAPHPFYGKVMRKFKKFHVHDEQNVAALGDSVRIMECKPLSHLKRWRLVGVAQDGKG